MLNFLTLPTPRKIYLLPACCHQGPAPCLLDVKAARPCVGPWVLPRATRAPGYQGPGHRIRR